MATFRLPLFPLDVVLFPGALMPLHIFEPRYRALLSDCRGCDQRFALLEPGEAGAGPREGALGTVARIRATQPLEDGRSNIVVAGEERFRLRELVVSETPYLVGLAEPLADDTGPDPVEGIDRLRDLAARYQRALRTLTDEHGRTTWEDDPARFTFQLAALLQVAPPVLRRILALRTASRRVRLLLELLPPLVEDLEGRARTHRGASRNGRPAPGTMLDPPDGP